MKNLFSFGGMQVDAWGTWSKTGLPYMEYVKAISQNDIAKKVKIADLKHNLDTRRTDGNKPPKYSTYIEALKYLENE